MHEVIAGPLSAIALPVVPPDPSFKPEVLYAEGGLFNFAWFVADRQGGQPTLTVEIRGEDGALRPGGRVVLDAVTEERGFQNLKEERGARER